MSRCLTIALAAASALGCGGGQGSTQRDSAAASVGAAVTVEGARIGAPRTTPAGEWRMPAGDYANSRYSELSQITAANATNLRASWTFSTGVLRGHEGQPLVVNNTMYLVTPYPNV